MERNIIAFGYHDQIAPRHWNICKNYKKEGIEVLECHTEAQGLLGKYMNLKKKYKTLISTHESPEAILVTFPGQYLVPLAWLLTNIYRRSDSKIAANSLDKNAIVESRLRKKKPKLIFDAFVSVWDSIVCDRKKVSPFNPYAWFLYCVDYLSCYLADEVWIDTQEHKKYFIKTFYLNPDKVKVVYLGTRSDLFCPNPLSLTLSPKERENKEVLFYGTYIPLQGVEYIVEAAKILKDSHPDIHFTLIGSGQTYRAVRKKADEYQLSNVTFVDRVPFEELPKRIRDARLCLGIFGTTDKAQRVIPHKVWDAVECGIPIITQESPAIREKFADNKKVILCKAGNPHDLAEKVELFFQ
jgi:glycosyltransferase involved in cell wall biosynthesis